MISLGLDALHIKSNVLAIRPHIMESDSSFEVGNEAQFDKSASGERPGHGYRGAGVVRPQQEPDTTLSWQSVMHFLYVHIKH